MSAEPNYPASFFAKLFDLTERRIQQLAKDGVIVGNLYRLTSRIVTAGGRTEDKTVEILCVQK